MFKKSLTAIFVAIIGITSAFAQSSDDYKKGEFYVGYSNGQVDTGIDADGLASDFFDKRVSFNGVNISGVYNVHRFVGVKADVSTTFNSNDLSVSGNGVTVSLKNKNTLWNVLGGVQIKDNANEGSRFRPFAHALVGLGHMRSEISDFRCTGTVPPGCPTPITGSFNESGFAGAFGGGIDIKVSKRVAIRAIQADFNPVWVDGGMSSNFRLGAGIVF